MGDQRSGRGHGESWAGTGRVRRCLGALALGVGVVALAPAYGGQGKALSAPSVAVDPLATACGEGEPISELTLSAAVAQALNVQPQLLMAKANALAAESQLTGAKSGFLPHIDLSAVDEQFVPHNNDAPIVVVGNTVLGGSRTNSGYISLGLQWNLWNGGQDVAAYRGAQAGVRSAAYGVDKQVNETLLGVLRAYADLYEAQVAARDDASAAAALGTMQTRAERRYARGYGTEVAVGTARVAALRADETLYGACQDLASKSAAFAEAVGLERHALRPLDVAGALPEPPTDLLRGRDVSAIVDTSPAVIQAREAVAAARQKLKRARGAFGPAISLSVQSDYLGQDPTNLWRANRHIGREDYRVGLELKQPLFPFTSEDADVERAHADLADAQAAYREARLKAQTQLLEALSARREVERSYAAAESSLADAEQVLQLTKAQYHAGRKDLDSVEHARIDRDAAEAALQELGVRRTFAEWGAASTIAPQEFPIVLFRELHLEVRAGTDRSLPR